MKNPVGDATGSGQASLTLAGTLGVGRLIPSALITVAVSGVGYWLGQPQGLPLQIVTAFAFATQRAIRLRRLGQALTTSCLTL